MVEFLFRAGGVSVEMGGGSSLMVYEAGQGLSARRRSRATPTRTRPTTFVACVREGRQPTLGTAEQARLAVRTANAVRRVVRDGRGRRDLSTAGAPPLASAGQPGRCAGNPSRPRLGHDTALSFSRPSITLAPYPGQPGDEVTAGRRDDDGRSDGHGLGVAGRPRRGAGRAGHRGSDCVVRRRMLLARSGQLHLEHPDRRGP